MQEENHTKFVAKEKPKNNLDIAGESYAVLKALGEGAFGKIYLIEKDNEKYALKIVRKAKLSDEDNRRTLLELELLTLLSDSAFIVNLHKGYEAENMHVFVLKYCSGGDLYNHWTHAGPFDENTALFYLAEIAVAVEVLHESGHIHRDMKLENVLINSDGHIVLADFGLSKVSASNIDKDFCGTLDYMAPEMLRKEEYNMSIDIWAIGIMAFEMLTGLHPFESETEKTKDRIKFEEPKFPEPNNLSKGATEFIKRLLNKNPKQRPYACEDDSGLFESYPLKKDNFFRKLKWNKVVNRQLTPPYIPLNQGPP